MTDTSRDTYQYTLFMLILYFVLTFVYTWAILFYALSNVAEGLQDVFIVAAAFGPFLSAIFTIWTCKGGLALRQWLGQIFTVKIPISLYLAGALLLPIGIGVLQYFLYRVLGGEPDFSGATLWYFYLAYLIPTALLSGGNEEPGWRGFALPALLERCHPLNAALILGIVHSFWHLPLMDLYETTMGWFLFGLIPLTVILNWFYLKSRNSIIPVMLLHAGTNVITSFIPTPMDVLGGFGTYMFLRGTVYWVIAIVLIVLTKGRLGYQPEDSAAARSVGMQAV